ncbi:hypothetical protein PAXINDRAFT_17746 [Paxillus involutus ATCC 200175]|uniref:Unplaced genomic scaffold PAXINscaffold_176, whole genome shotgun sequence n=1 Tax=Paxillus involutus ATCC 200175 TaxID=664439 RepID=A0A0C9TN08_PAXIN|nr:hypothetical protein PAXINDRAFT_17746 [Paxillus involutus ATCC 200175]
MQPCGKHTRQETVEYSPPTKSAMSSQKSITIVPKVEVAEDSNAVVGALRSTAQQKLTTNAAPTFDSTLIPTLDAFLGLDTYLQVTGQELGCMLENAWAEDPALTLRIIWNARSIHDGKGDKELFYRFISSRLDFLN